MECPKLAIPVSFESINDEHTLFDLLIKINTQFNRLSSSVSRFKSTNHFRLIPHPVGAK